MDRLLSMSVFAKAVESGSFSAAGEALRMSSQLVGKHVQTLEQHLKPREKPRGSGLAFIHLL